ncbi:hypothetical protein BU23DRAFT_515751 [Bimuria novae-zelandiae CBS 107.79]|uniref:Rhodopsin domain-containing protein n=1 Tax=Bimuria novae-zelandiae CBS 107.79 TaxID=1447943 RepID=A0A6A5UVD5_9PLEO|nr:hypothetical protein BU23DRAFT_515751 [Bimuria novae-zelandiae CBS 107.79]
MLILLVVIVVLRTYVRARVVRNFGKDDACMIGALIFTLGYMVAIWIARNNGMGYSGKVLQLYQMRNLVQLTLAIQIIYYVLIAFIKISICFCYLRIAANNHFARMCKGTIYFLTLFCLICVVVCLTQCIPLHEMWNFTGVPLGECINTTALFYTTSSINIVADIWVIALPISTLLKIQRPTREKAGLIVAFSLGVLSTISSIIRLHSIRIFTESPDPFYDAVPINLWSMVEVNIGIWCASIPALRVLIIRHRAASQASRSAGTYKFHSSGRSGGKDLGRSNEGSNQATVESFDMGTIDLTNPEQAKQASKIDSEWSDEAQLYPVHTPIVR